MGICIHQRYTRTLFFLVKDTFLCKVYGSQTHEINDQSVICHEILLLTCNKKLKKNTTAYLCTSGLILLSLFFKIIIQFEK